MTTANKLPNIWFNITAEKRGEDFTAQIPNFCEIGRYLAAQDAKREPKLRVYRLGDLYADVYFKLLRPAPEKESDFTPIPFNDLLLDMVVALTPFDNNTKSILHVFLGKTTELTEIALYQPERWALADSYIDKSVTNESLTGRLEHLLVNGFDNEGDWL